MSQPRPLQSDVPEAPIRNLPSDLYEITIFVKLIDPEAVLKHGRRRYTEAPAINEDGQPIEPEEFVTAVDEALTELFRLHCSESQGVEQLELLVERRS